MSAVLLFFATVANAAGFQISAATTTATLGVPVAIHIEGPSGARLDLERSSTDYYALSEPKPLEVSVVPLAVGAVPVRIFLKDDPLPQTLLLQVSEPVLAADADVADIKKPARARPALWPFLLIVALVAGAWYWWRRRKAEAAAPEEAFAAVDARTAEQIVFDELSALEAGDLWTSGKFKEFYGLLTEALRNYFEKRFAFPASKLTTWELARELRRLEVDRETMALFKALFERADLVKFAKTTPDPGQGGLDLESARRIVNGVRPRDLAATEAKP